MNNLEIKIGTRKIGKHQPCFIVAELSGNHHQRYEEAVELVKQAKEAGADAVKLQTYTPDITLNSRKKWFIVGAEGGRPGAWVNKSLWELYEKAHTPWEWQPKLKKLADELGIILFSSPFFESAVDFLEREVQPPCYKIASYEAVHIPLIKHIAQTRKPVIMSIGFANEEEASLAVRTLRENGCIEFAVLHCVTSYSDNPRIADMNLATIGDIAERFGVIAGFSDNNAGIELPVAAVAAGGAKVLEKHFTLDRDLGGPDAQFSIETAEFKRMVQFIRRAEQGEKEEVLKELGLEDAEQVMGEVQYGPANSQEKANKNFRPSIWVSKSIQQGELLTKDNIRVARPGAGLPPKYFEEVLGKRASRDIEAATPFSWSLVE